MDDAETPSTRRKEKLVTFVTFVFFSLFEAGYLYFHPPTFRTWRDWIVPAGAALFPLMTIISFFSFWNDWSLHREEQMTMRMFGIIVGVPLALLAIAICFLLLQPVFAWFAALPAGMAVVILLLVLIYLKK
jgi:hypothetical protein